MTRRLRMARAVRPLMVLVPLLGLGAAAGVLYQGRAAFRRSTTGAAVASLTTSAVPRGPSFSAFGWQRGTEYVQELDYRFELAPAGAEPSAPAAGAALHVTGAWRTLVVGGPQGGTRLKVEIAHAAIANQNPAAAQAMAEASRSLARPFYVDYDAQGRALRLHLAKDTDRLALGILRELVSISQFSEPAPVTASWQALESDQSGEYRADYRSLGFGKFERVKALYVKANPAQSAGVFGGGVPVIGKALAVFELDDWGRSAKLDATHELSTPGAENGTGYVSRTRLALKFLERRQGVEVGGDLTNLVTLGLAPAASDVTDAAADLDRQLVDGADADSLLRELSQLAEGDRDGGFAIQTRLAALFRLDPRAIDKALSRLDAKNAANILGALGSAGTPAAQKALAAFASDTGRDAAERQLAVDSMLAVEHPTPELRGALKGMLSEKDPELKNNASLMLGVMAGRDADPSATVDIVQQMSRELKTADSVNERIRLIDSLGNTRSDAALPALSEALASDNAEVRTAATAALRFVSDPAADRLLSTAITSDDSPDVRRSALIAAGYRAYEPLASALETVAKGDPSSAVRAQAVTTLQDMTQKDNQALPLLDWIAQNDKDPQVRARARRAVESPPL
jgi:HEAT repeat protein